VIIPTEGGEPPKTSEVVGPSMRRRWTFHWHAWLVKKFARVGSYPVPADKFAVLYAGFRRRDVQQRRVLTRPFPDQRETGVRVRWTRKPHAESAAKSAARPRFQLTRQARNALSAESSGTKLLRRSLSGGWFWESLELWFGSIDTPGARLQRRLVSHSSRPSSRDWQVQAK